MKLNDTELYLTLTLRALEASVLPHLEPAAAREAGALIKGCLEQLLTRQRIPAQRLRDSLAEAAALEHRLLAVARERHIEMPPVEHRAADIASIDAFEPYAAAHEAFSIRLGRLMRAISRRQRGISESDDAEIAALLREAASWEERAHAMLLQPAENAPDVHTGEASLGQEALETFIRRHHADGDSVKLSRFERLAGGYGKQTYLITIEEGDGRQRELVVRKDDPAPFLTHPSCVIEREFHLVKAVAATGFPAPRPLWAGIDVPGVDANFYVMERLPGRPPGVFIEAGGDHVPESILFDLADYLAQLHNLSLDKFSEFIGRFDDPELLSGRDTIEHCYRRRIANWRRHAETSDLPPTPIAEYLFDWLDANVPRNSNAPVLTHGDYNIHNVLAQDGRITGILDWELASFGAPEADIAYIKPMICKHMAWETFLERYRAGGGRPIDESSMHFYLAFWGMRARLAAGRVVSNLHAGKTTDLRLTTFELAFNPYFMKMALDNTAP